MGSPWKPLLFSGKNISDFPPPRIRAVNSKKYDVGEIWSSLKLKKKLSPYRYTLEIKEFTLSTGGKRIYTKPWSVWLLDYVWLFTGLHTNQVLHWCQTLLSVGQWEKGPFFPDPPLKTLSLPPNTYTQKSPVPKFQLYNENVNSHMPDIHALTLTCEQG